MPVDPHFRRTPVHLFEHEALDPVSYQIFRRIKNLVDITAPWLIKVYANSAQGTLATATVTQVGYDTLYYSDYSAAVQSIAGRPGTIGFPVALGTGPSGYPYSTFTAPIAGKYSFTARVSAAMGTSAAGARCNPEIIIGSTTHNAQVSVDGLASGTVAYMINTVTDYLQPGTTVIVKLSNQSGGTVTYSTGLGSQDFSIMYLGQ